MIGESKLVIREIKPEEIAILENMLYESIYQPDELNLIPREVIKLPEVSVYIDDFGEKEDDFCLVAIIDSKIIGAVWVRILADKIKGFGNINDKTPEFAISLFKEYRKKGIGTLLMKEMISCLVNKGYKQASLSVQKKNYAFKMYAKLGFEILKESSEDYLMVLNLLK